MSLYELIGAPDLHEPLLVMGLEGWIDAGLGGATAMATILSALDTEVVARFDADVLLDHRARRPTMQIRDGRNTGLLWPEIELRAAADRRGNHLLLLVGPEPDHRWRAFCRDVSDLAARLGTRMALGLGAFPAPSPHTRPVILTSTATTPELAERIGFSPSQLDVPAGAHGALERSFADVGIPAAGIWARVPHYVAGMAYPAAAAALVDAVARVGGVSLPSGDLHAAAEEVRRRIDQLVAQNPQHQTMVATLEAQAGDEASPRAEAIDPDSIPSGDELAAELERFLRGESGQQ